MLQVRLQLLEMSSITTPNQTILNVCTRYLEEKPNFPDFSLTGGHPATTRPVFAKETQVKQQTRFY